MAEAVYKDVRVEESLRVKIGEAKNLPGSSFSGSGRNTCCAIKIDSEEIFRTSTVEKSTNPFFGAEFQGEIPKKFRCLSFYVYEVGNKNKVLGKVSLKKEELYKYHQKEHWFPLTYQDSDIEVQGKVHVEVKLDEFLAPSADMSHRMSVRVPECSDLTVINGSCNPYAVVTLSYGKSKTKDVKKTAVRKKTICPQFDEKFFFYIDNKGQNQEKNLYAFEDFMAGELSVSLFHDDSKVSREVLGNIFKGCFLGEVKIPIRDIDITRPHKAWYCLQAKEQNRANNQSLGSIRLRISYTSDYVFPSKYYDGLRNLILESAETSPFTSSAVFILGEIVNHRESSARENAAKPLVKLFLHHGKLVPLIYALANWEMSCTVDPNTLFRGNSLLTKMVDELMKIVGMPYLHDTLKSFVDQVVSEVKPCEIDPTRLKDGEDAVNDLANLYAYVNAALTTIVSSGLVCPPIMRDVFSTLKSQAMLNYPDNTAVRYHAVTSFIFLRFFTAAIMGPTLFDLCSDILEPSIQRTFTLISKGISGLVTLVSSKSNNVTAKEEYMAPLFEMFPKSTQTDIKMFLDIISSSSGCHFKGIEAPIILKEGFLIKRAQGRKRFGLKNFKKRFFRLSNQTFSYSKCKGDRHQLFEIPITEILAVERLEEESFKMKYMFQVIHAQRALYIQANNCVEEKEWLDILTKICKSNKNRLKVYHPAAFVNNHWLCCKSSDHSLPGCKPVTGDLPITDIVADTGEIDSDREVEKIHSIFLSVIELLDALQGFVDEEEDEYGETCGSQAVYSGDTELRSTGLGSNIEDPSSCFATIAEIQRCIITLEQEHIQYMRSVQRRTVIGSIDTPIGDESSADLVRNMNRSSERLSRHGSRSSNASNISRRSFRGCRSRGGSFREREKGKTEGEGVRKSLSGDVAVSSRSLGAEFATEVKKAASYDVMAVESGESRNRARTSSGDGKKDMSPGIIDSHITRDCFLTDSSSRDTDSGIKVGSESSPIDVVLSATDSEVFTSPDVRQPKISTGFTPTAFPYSEDHIASFSHRSSDTTSSFENINITPDVLGSRLHSDSDLTHVSPVSQNVGVLETSLDSGDVITTTIGLSDAEGVSQTPRIVYHTADSDNEASKSQPSCDEYSNHSVQNSSSNLFVSSKAKSDLDLSLPNGELVGSQECVLVSNSQASKSSLQNSGVNEIPSGPSLEAFAGVNGDLSSADVTLGDSILTADNKIPAPLVSQTSNQDSNHNLHVHQNCQDTSLLLEETDPAAETLEAVNDVNHNRSSHSHGVNSDKDTVYMFVESGHNSLSSELHPKEGVQDQPSRNMLNSNCCSASDDLTVNQQSSLEGYKISQTLQHRTPEKQTSSNAVNQHSVNDLDIVRSVQQTNLRRQTGEASECLRNDVQIVTNAGGVSELTDGQLDHSASTSNEDIKYSLPELTSSGRACLHSADPKRSSSIMTIESNGSTPAVSPSDVATIEIMLTSSESISSQEKS